MTLAAKPYIYVSLTVLLWASTAAVGKLLLRTMGALPMLMLISLFAAAALFCVAVFKKKWAVIRRYRPADYLRFAVMGFLGVFLYYGLLFAGLKYAPAQEAFIINYTWPVWVVIFAMIFLREQCSLPVILAVLLGFAGVFIVVTKGGMLNPTHLSIKGDLLALGAAVSYGLFTVFGKKYSDDPVTSMMFYYFFSFLYSIIPTLLFSHIPQQIPLRELAGIIWMGAFNGGLGYLFWFSAVKTGNLQKISNIVFLTPFLSLVYIYVLLGEPIMTSSLAGLLVIIGGIIIQQRVSAVPYGSGKAGRTKIMQMTGIK